MRYAVIMAGGVGKRLWPLSRAGRPKQLLPLIRGKSLLELAVQRLEGLFAPENTWVITSAHYAEQVAAALPDLPPANIIGEPQGRDTANAVALGAALLRARDADGTMAVFTADHVIRPVERFAEAVGRACDAAERHGDSLLTLGVRPTWPHTGLGYIHCGGTLPDGVHEVLAFKEKPDHRLARRYVESGRHYWNSGMFVWTLRAIAAALEEFLPESVRKLDPVTEAVRGGRDLAPVLEEAYGDLQRISIDFAVMEKARKVLMVELNCEWLDVGAWPSLEDVAELDQADNVVVGEHVVALDSGRNVIVTQDDHLVGVVGLDDCIVVHSPDATLVCSKTDSQRLKDLVGLIEEKYGGRYV